MPTIFEITKTSSQTKARAGVIHTVHGPVETPIFAPVGTQGSVKTLLSEDLEVMDAPLILANTYHLYLRPGIETLEKAGGLHKFMSWNRAILTDSGGYQVFSLEDLRKVTEEGVEFRSHLDGAKLFLSPEKATDIQMRMGSDIVMAFDECPPYPSTDEVLKSAVERTTRWAARCQETFRPQAEKGYLLYAITQGGINPILRRQSTEQLVQLNFPGYALGGLSLGEPHEQTLEMVSLSTELLPTNKPRYLMGVGTPEDLWEAVSLGIDQFDCVLPTRNGRNGQLFTSRGKVNIRNAPYRHDFSPIDPECSCALCTRYSRAYLHHLFRAGELSALRLASLHNVTFLVRLTRFMREAILKDRFLDEKKRFFDLYFAGQ